MAPTHFTAPQQSLSRKKYARGEQERATRRSLSVSVSLSEGKVSLGLLPNFSLSYFLVLMFLRKFESVL